MDEQSQQEMYRLTRENNKMLHSMRRNALVSGIIKFIFWAILLLAPIWFYMTYLNTTVQQMLQTMQSMQGTSAKAQAQFADFSSMIKAFQSKFGSGSSSTQ